jgi:site-specific recombinase XerD
MTSHLPAHVPTHVPTPGVGRIHPPVLPSELTEKVSQLREASKSANTRKAYRSDWSQWEAWCNTQGVTPLPAHPDTVTAYLADKAEKVKVSTLTRHLATISKAHEVAGFQNPCRVTQVRDTLAGLRNTYGTARREAPGLLRDALRATLDTLGGDLSGTRDRALLLTGWCAGLRRSELAGLTWGDLVSDPDGLVLILRRSKTDQAGEGRSVGLFREADSVACPVQALDSWRVALGKQSPLAVAPGAPVFPRINRWGQVSPGAMSGQSVAEVIQRRTAQAGLPTRYQGHSLRKGLVQQATLAGVSDSAVMATTGHQSVTMLRRYQSTAGLVSKSASKGLLS